ncbi:MAG: hypothetical protein R2860_02705 [Desulfobacterales bacterium]
MGSSKKRSQIRMLRGSDHCCSKKPVYIRIWFNVSKTLFPLARLLAGRENVSVDQLSGVLDILLPPCMTCLARHSKSITRFLRHKNVIPNEKSGKTHPVCYRTDSSPEPINHR